MKKEATIFLNHIIDAIERIENTLKGKNKEHFSDNVDIQDATIRRIEVIGEAAKNIPEDFKKNYPLTPWKEIAGMRDRLIHQYFGVNLDRVWIVVEKELR